MSTRRTSGCGPLSWKWALVLLLLVIILGAVASSCRPKKVTRLAPTYTAEGYASWYGPGFHGRTTANGERYNQYAMTAAHKKLPFNTKVRVINLDNGMETIVRINDRGPFIRGRIIDLSKKAAKEIAMLGSGTARVRVETLVKRKPIEPSKSAPPKRQRQGFKRIPTKQS